MTTAILKSPSIRVHNIVEYIRNSGNFLCDVGELEERSVEDILQKDFNIYQALSAEEISVIAEELQDMAIANEIREASYLFKKLHPDDAGGDYLHSNPNNDFGSRSTYIVEYSYQVDENLRKLPKINYPLRPASELETRRLAAINKLHKKASKACNN